LNINFWALVRLYNVYSIVEVLELAIKNNCKDIVSKILGLSIFKAWSKMLKFALENEHKKVASEIVRHSGFETYNSWGYKGYELRDLLMLALDKQCQQVALKIAEHSKFDPNSWRSYEDSPILRLAIENGYEELVSKVIERYNPSPDDRGLWQKIEVNWRGSKKDLKKIKDLIE